MKQIIRPGKVTIILLGLGVLFILNAQKAIAMSANKLSCPEKYIATVINVEDVASSTFPKIEVDFQIIQTLKGEKILSKKIQIVKDGPVQFKDGEIYTLEANNQWLCSAAVFTKL